MLHSLVKVTSFQKDLDLFFSSKTASIYLKGFCGILKLNMPSIFFFKNSYNSINLLFSNKFFFKSFVRHLMVFNNYLTVVYFIKIKVRGLGYRIRKLSEFLYYFFFNYTNYFYLYLPRNIFLSVYKKRAIFVGYN
jgi:hypothetical protein